MGNAAISAPIGWGYSGVSGGGPLRRPAADDGLQSSVSAWLLGHPWAARNTIGRGSDRAIRNRGRPCCCARQSGWRFRAVTPGLEATSAGRDGDLASPPVRLRWPDCCTVVSCRRGATGVLCSPHRPSRIATAIATARQLFRRPGPWVDVWWLCVGFERSGAGHCWTDFARCRRTGEGSHCGRGTKCARAGQLGGVGMLPIGHRKISEA